MLQAPRIQDAARYAGLFGRDQRTPDSFWTSLRYFNVYRMVVTALFLGITVFYGDALNLGSHQLGLFRGVCLAYLVLATVFHSLLRNLRDLFNLQLSAHLALDIVAITLLMYASGGIRSGLGVMLLIAITGAGMVSWLAQRVAANESLARERGRALDTQLRVNQLVIADMQDGVHFYQ